MSQRRLWTPEEDQIIIKLVAQHGTKKWTNVAQEMARFMPPSSRSSKQIRERWHNHLDPTVIKKQWTKQEQAILFESHRLLGSRWKEIANKLQGRTDNHVKNYFYSTMRRALRRVNKFLGSKNSTTQMRTIRPSILSYLLDIADTDTEIRILVSKILEFSKLKPKKCSDHSIFVDGQKLHFQNAIAKLMELNQIYSKRGSRKLNDKQNIELLQKSNYLAESSTRPKQQQYTGREYPEEEGHEEIELEQKNWEEANQESYHCHFMPELEKPDYECDLLTKKQQSVDPSNHTQFYLADPVWAHEGW